MSDFGLLRDNRDKEMIPDPANGEPEPYFESPVLHLQGIVQANRPALVQRERYVSEMISRMVQRLFRYALAKCMAGQNADIASEANTLQQEMLRIDDAGLSDQERFTELALRHTGDILAFKQRVYNIRNQNDAEMRTSEKLDTAVSELRALRETLGYAA